jgi:tetratricopeptide (TPR) repeat protein
VYVNIGNLTEAQKCYQKALALNPDYETTLLNYAALQLLLQNKNAAKNLLQRALKINPNNNQAKTILQSI